MSFLERGSSFLGAHSPEEGFAVDYAKVIAVQDWKAPNTEVRSFLGLVGYYRKFIRDFAQFRHHSRALLRRIWGMDCEDSFMKHKRALTSAPVLVLPDGAMPSTLYTDACGAGLGAVLMEEGRVYLMQVDN